MGSKVAKSVMITNIQLAMVGMENGSNEAAGSSVNDNLYGI